MRRPCTSGTLGNGSEILCLQGWRAKVFLYCVEARCPQTGWMVPLLPTLIVSKGYDVVAELVPDTKHKRYDIAIRSGVTEKQFAQAAQGTVRSDGRGQDPYLIHAVGPARISFRSERRRNRGRDRPQGLWVAGRER